MGDKSVRFVGESNRLYVQPGHILRQGDATDNTGWIKSLLTLMAPLTDLGYDLYTDRFYTSPMLVEELLRVETTLTGTVMTNRKNMPAATKCSKQRRGDVSTYSKGKMVVMQWTDKRMLTTLTSKHDNS